LCIFSDCKEKEVSEEAYDGLVHFYAAAYYVFKSIEIKSKCSESVVVREF
jgi:hypothetical protein